jgi:hypothetical protein
MKQVKFKTRSRPSPELENIFFIFYNDKYCTSVHEIWRVSIHSLLRQDVTCITGQTNVASLVVRGSSTHREAKCYSNAPHDILVITIL